MEILAIQVHILSAPAFDIQIKPTCRERTHSLIAPCGYILIYVSGLPCAAQAQNFPWRGRRGVVCCTTPPSYQSGQLGQETCWKCPTEVTFPQISGDKTLDRILSICLLERATGDDNSWPGTKSFLCLKPPNANSWASVWMWLPLAIASRIHRGSPSLDGRGGRVKKLKPAKELIFTDYNSLEKLHDDEVSHFKWTGLRSGSHVLSKETGYHEFLGRVCHGLLRSYLCKQTSYSDYQVPYGTREALAFLALFLTHLGHLFNSCKKQQSHSQHLPAVFLPRLLHSLHTLTTLL